jgi:hypothetical protein
MEAKRENPGRLKVGYCQQRNLKNTEDTESAENHREITIKFSKDEKP